MIPKTQMTHRVRRAILPVAALLAGFLLLSVPEIVVRFVDPTVDRYRGILFANDPASLDLFINDPDLHWKLRPSVSVRFVGTTAQTNELGLRSKPLRQGTQRILSLGDSSTFGWRVKQSDSYPAQLEGLLNKHIPPRQWEVVNAGVPGYSSFQVQLFAERLVPFLKPKLVIINVGNNEAWLGHRSDLQIHEDRHFTRAIEKITRRSMFVLWLREYFQTLELPHFHPELPIGPLPRVSREEYKANLIAVVQFARLYGSQPILVGPPVNIYQLPSNLAGAEFRQWQDWLQSTLRLVEIDPLAAVAKAEVALTSDPENFYPLWLKGYALSRAGDYETGRAVLEHALEIYNPADRAKLSYRKAVAEIAQLTNVPYIDPNELFREADNGRLPVGFYLDVCHPSPKGHSIIAAKLVETVKGIRERDGNAPQAN